MTTKVSSITIASASAWAMADRRFAFSAAIGLA
jgi:hypothetical protein